jgi:mono/diheme cytochrome c family protein
MIKRLFLALVAIALAAAIGAYLWATRHGEIAAIDPPDPASIDAALVAEGEMLAGIGNCASCHTAEGGADYAGGYSTATPFGIVYSTNITPHPEQGIGRWSEEAFARAMRDGINREGDYLYPVFPYDHFTILTDKDISALYAFLMTRPPAESVGAENDLAFPYDNRLLLAGWQLVNLDDRRFVPDPDQGETWNRGAYLVEGLGHCGACHTPRDRLGGLDGAAKFSGAALAAGWWAPALDDSNPDPLPWTEDAMVNYLLDGWDRDHGIAAGPMRSVVHNLNTHLSEGDAYAMAEYLLSFMPKASEDVPSDDIRAAADARSLTGAVLNTEEIARTEGDPLLAQGQEIFARSCANCHRQGTDTVPLALTTSVNLNNPGNLIAVTRHGITAPVGSASRSMPAFPQLTRDDLIALAAFTRWQHTDRPAWEGIAEAVDEVLAGAE